MFKESLSNRLPLRYLQVGAVSALANFLLFALVRTFLDEQKSDFAALSISTTLAIFFAFYLQSTFVWKTGYADSRAGAKFLVLNILAFVLNLFLMKALTDLGFDAIWAQGISLICIASASYIVQKKWVFLARD
jgi:putative flippase GtrA